MNYRVIKYFIDRDSLKEFNAGDLFPCENPERAAQLIKRCYIERISEPLKAPNPEELALEKEAEKPKQSAKGKSTAKKTASKKKA